MFFNFAKECLSDSKDDFNIKSERFKTSKVILGCFFALSMGSNYLLAKRILNLNAELNAISTAKPIIDSEHNTHYTVNTDVLLLDLESCQQKLKYYSNYVKEKCNKNTSTTLSDVNKPTSKVNENVK